MGGLEVFDSPETFAKVLPKLVRRSALDAIEFPGANSPMPPLDWASAFLRQVATAGESFRPGSPGSALANPSVASLRRARPCLVSRSCSGSLPCRSPSLPLLGTRWLFKFTSDKPTLHDAPGSTIRPGPRPD